MNIENKILEICFVNGEIWQIDAHIIAHTRATYYAEKDIQDGSATDFDTVYKQEYEHALDDHADLIDYAKNNMDWEDFEGYRTQVNTPQDANYSNEWRNAPMEVIEANS